MKAVVTLNHSNDLTWRGYSFFFFIVGDCTLSFEEKQAVCHNIHAGRVFIDCQKNQLSAIICI